MLQTYLCKISKHLQHIEAYEFIFRELMASPNKEAVIEELEEQRKHLEADRERYTEATLKLGREKAAFEVR